MIYANSWMKRVRICAVCVPMPPFGVVLPNLIAQPIINTRYLQQVVGLSKPQAERAIKTLSERGVVVARTGKQRSVVYEHRGILDVLGVMGVTSFQQSLYEFFDSGLLFRIALLQKTILFLLFL